MSGKSITVFLGRYDAITILVESHQALVKLTVDNEFPGDQPKAEQKRKTESWLVYAYA